LLDIEIVFFLLIRPQHKMFVTEEKMIKDLQILSLDLPVNDNTTLAQTSRVDEYGNVL
jgi:hypothetical protein